MRRLWAHVILSASAVIMMAAGAVAFTSNSRSNLEYTEGREISFRISDPEGTYKGNKTLAEEAAIVMEQRLVNNEVSQYVVKTAGDDIVKVDVTQQSDSDYQSLAGYLSAYGEMTLTNKSSISAPLVLSDIKTGNAYVETLNEIAPVINIPINTKDKSGQTNFKSLKEETLKDESNAEIEKEGEGEEAKEKKVYYFYLWFDYTEGVDAYEKTVSGSESYDEVVASHLSPIKFNIEEVDTDVEDTTLKMYLKVDADGDGKASEKEIKDAFKNAYLYANMLNATALPYHIETITNDNYHTAQVLVESLVQYGTLVASKTMISVLVAIGILSLLLVVFYKLGALSIATSTILSSLASLGILIALGGELTTAAIVGVCLVTIASMACGVIYMTKLKEDCYKGHTLKKANAEAAKKSLLPIVDINVIVMVVGALCFAIGGTLMKSFAIVTVLGGLVSLLVNLLVLRGLMWLATNSTGMIGKYNAFAVEADKVPDHMKEEKQTYFGAFADKDFTKKKKPMFFVTIGLFLASVVGMITIGTLTGGYLFNTGNNVMNSSAGNIAQISEIYIGELKEKNSEDYTLLDSDITSAINNLLIYEEKVETSKLKPFSSIVKDFKNDTTTYVTYEFKTPMDSEEEQGKQEFREYRYLTISLTQTIGENFQVLIKDTTEPIDVVTAFTLLLDDIYAGNVYDITDKAVVKQVSQKEPSWALVSLASLAAAAILTFYFCLRYRLSRGLTTIFFPIIASAVTMGFMCLLRIVTPTYAMISIPVVVAFTFIISVIFMNKEREMVIEDKARDNSFENRNNIMKKANSLAFTPIITVTVLAVYLGINFFGFGPGVTSTYYLMMIIGILFSALIVTTLFGPLSQVFFKLFSKVHIERKPRKNKKNSNVQVHKSSEPEEAIFIGIND